MSTQVFPSLTGQGWDVVRIPVWSTLVAQATSGKEVRIPEFTYPLYEYEVTFDVLRQGTINGNTYTEMAQLMGFYNARQGMADSFLYTDTADNSVTAQAIGTGDGSTTTFQLVRAFGSFVEPIFAPNVVSHVYRAGTDHSDWSVSNWGTSTPGLVTFNAAPSNGQAITADFTYYWPCRFTMDKFPINNFVALLYAGKKLTFTTVKA